ncbi:MAG: hypothetical protein SGI99_11460 [Pseudomonadota bacterium]|nr:hypothetical protein [Pseudomonadota bacterium]
MMENGLAKSINSCAFVWSPESRRFIALMAGPFCMQLSMLEALALAELMRQMSRHARASRTHSTLTQIREENWSVVASDAGSVALLRRALMLRFTPDEADIAAELLEEAADAMNPERFGEVANA